MRPKYVDNTPPELWSAIFAFLAHSDLSNVRLTGSRRFVPLIQPLLFKQLTFCVYDRQAPEGYIPLSEDRLAYLLERLAFWSCEEIAPWVHACSVFGLRHDPEDRLATEDRLFDALVDALSRFANIHELSMTEVGYTPALLRAIASLPNLRSVEIAHSYPDERVSSDSLTDHETGLTRNALRIGTFTLLKGRNDQLAHWVDTFIDPEALQALKINLDPGIVNALLRRENPFPSVTRLSLIPEMKMELTTASRILALFPATEELFAHMSFENSSPHDVIEVDMPSLQSYTGSIDTFSSIVFRVPPAIHRLNTGWDSQSAFLGSARVVELKLSIPELDYTIMHQIAGAFPRLEELCIEAANMVGLASDEISSFFSMLSTNPIGALPPTIRSLAITLPPPFGPNFDSDEEAAAWHTPIFPDPRPLRVALCEAFPSLQSLWLDDYCETALYFWRREMSKVWYRKLPDGDKTEEAEEEYRAKGVQTAEEYWEKALDVWWTQKPQWDDT
ncbi:hypothetical protein C8F01DRAFT_1234471 [Mycena amicta]|nr:hypothetical protein C8F01DRAFT_1234471 [Mycena amicta]